MAAIAVVLLLAVLFFWSRTRGPYHDYELDTVSDAGAPVSVTLQAGVAKRDISPPPGTYDTWTDADGDGIFREGVDSYEDANGNGRFDPLWLAGFDNPRAAQGMAQPIDVRALALRNNGTTVVLVTADMIGVVHNDVLAIREAVDPALGIGHILISATHTHEVPDPVGMWSHPVPFISFEPSYIDFVRPRIVEAIEDAVAALEPAEMYCVQTVVPEEGFVRDSRLPRVMDPNLYAFRFAHPDKDETIATFVNWGNHPDELFV